LKVQNIYIRVLDALMLDAYI